MEFNVIIKIGKVVGCCAGAWTVVSLIGIAMHPEKQPAPLASPIATNTQVNCIPVESTSHSGAQPVPMSDQDKADSQQAIDALVANHIFREVRLNHGTVYVVVDRNWFGMSYKGKKFPLLLAAQWGQAMSGTWPAHILFLDPMTNKKVASWNQHEKVLIVE